MRRKSQTALADQNSGTPPQKKQKTKALVLYVLLHHRPEKVAAGHELAYVVGVDRRVLLEDVPQGAQPLQPSGVVLEAALAQRWLCVVNHGIFIVPGTYSRDPEDHEEEEAEKDG